MGQCDARGQITAGDRTADDESYAYDENGNRITAGEPSSPVPYTTGPNNQILFDGTYTYTYDAAGNRTSRTDAVSGAVTEYTWDHRNRLVGVEEHDRPAIDLDGYTLVEYGNQDSGTPTAEVQGGGRTLHLAGNTWKAISFPYTVTADTILEFDFESPADGEIYGIGFDTDLGLSQGYVLQVGGTQVHSQTHDILPAYETGDGERHYRIRVGDTATTNQRLPLVCRYSDN